MTARPPRLRLPVAWITVAALLMTAGGPTLGATGPTVTGFTPLTALPRRLVLTVVLTDVAQKSDAAPLWRRLTRKCAAGRVDPWNRVCARDVGPDVTCRWLCRGCQLSTGAK